MQYPNFTCCCGGYDGDLCSGVDVGGNGCGFVVVVVGGMMMIVVGIFTRVEAEAAWDTE